MSDILLRPAQMAGESQYAFTQRLIAYNREVRAARAQSPSAAAASRRATAPVRMRGEPEAAFNRRQAAHNQELRYRATGVRDSARTTAATRVYPQPDPDEAIVVAADPYHRNPYPQVNDIRQFVKDELAFRSGSSLYGNTLVSRTPFARMTSGLGFSYSGHAGYKFLSLGLEGYTPATHFDQIYTDGSVIGYAVNPQNEQELIKVPLLTENQTPSDRRANNLYHSPPGITSVKVEKKSAKSIYSSVVTWKCYDRNQLEALRPHFLKAGGTIVLEWGYVADNTRNLECFDFTNQTHGEKTPNVDILDRLAKYYRTGKDSIIHEYVDPNRGNADCVVGFCSNLEIALEQDGTFTCTTNIMSMPETLFGVSNIHTLTGDNPAASNLLSVKDYYLPDGEFLHKLARDSNPPTSELSNPLVVARMSQIIDTSPSAKKFLTNGAVLVNDANGISRFGATGMSPSASAAFEKYKVSNAGAADSIEKYFISWGYFIHEIIPDSLGWYNSGFTEVERVISMVNRRNESTTVSYSPALLSTDPGVLVVFNASAIANPLTLTNSGITRQAAARQELTDTSISEFVPIGVKQDKALLETGVYLNVGKIIEIFSKTEKFIDAFEALLSAMNTAMSGFWNLTLIFDEAIGKFVVVDEGQINLHGSGNTGDPRPSAKTIKEHAYTFNSGSMSDALECNFRSTLIDLEKSNIMMSTNGARVSTPDQTNSQFNLLPNSSYEDILRAKIRLENRYSNPAPNVTYTGLNAQTRALAGIDNRAIVSLRESLFLTRTGHGASAREVNRLAVSLLPGQDHLIINQGGEFAAPRDRGTPANARPDLHKGEDYHAAAGDAVNALYTGKLSWDAYDPKVENNGVRYTLEPAGMPRVRVIYDHLTLPGPAGYLSGSRQVQSNNSLGARIYNVNNNSNSNISGPHLHLEYTIDGIQAPFSSIAPIMFQHGYQDEMANIQGQILTAANVQVPMNRQQVVANTVLLSEAQSVAGSTAAEIARVTALREQTLAQQQTQGTIVSCNYGLLIAKYIAVNPRGMFTNLIRPSNGSNPFNGPALVKVELELTIMGIGGLSVTDCFKLDKIPEQYMQMGIFMIRGITENITPKGWTTSL